MYTLTTDNGVELHSSKEQAVESLMQLASASIDEVRITPDILVLYYGLDTPFTLLDDDEQARILYEIVIEFLDIEKIAAKHVIGELEHIQLVGADETPSDIHPNESDNARYNVSSQLYDMVDASVFDSGVLDDVETALKHKVDKKVSEYWQHAKRCCGGNPAMAAEGELADAIQEVINEHDNT